ncbi:unnamed protein product [Vitrella brassicaformis CCMP3155]|uniref:Uncharacterized protein n=1 Tax=Vitrella brassicaformis (strain CCMP3155) TaxID=1169540 RepID=A0A0G4ERN7_VITBC|nr:unnamed protein product [Vitrella brassicaformis CCMP3155]|eukprot:CEM00699.1 unnamed protein product [Vitrella brassicaformis CCMP3155]
MAALTAVETVIPSVEAASPGQPDAAAKSPPSTGAPEPTQQTKPADTILTVDGEALSVISKIKRRNIHDAVRAAKSLDLSILQVGDTPFIVAAQKGHVGIMSMMYASKPDIGHTAMHYAAQNMHYAAEKGHVAAVNQLLDWDPKLIDARTKYRMGMTPFITAARLEWGGGAFLDIKDSEGKTLWDYAGKADRKIMEKYRR